MLLTTGLYQRPGRRTTRMGLQHAAWPI